LQDTGQRAFDVLAAEANGLHATQPVDHRLFFTGET
jgi:hypothetical protein